MPFHLITRLTIMEVPSMVLMGTIPLMAVIRAVIPAADITD